MSESDNAAAALFRDAARPFVRRVRIRNYRSIERCDVELAPLTVLVGRNAAGKSNFLDALRFVVEGLRTSLDHAIKARGGIDAVRRRSTGHPRNFAMELSVDLPEYQACTYGFEITAREKGAFVVKHERLAIRLLDGETVAQYDVRNGAVSASRLNMPPAAPDRLYLVNAAGLPEYRPVYDALLAMGFYNLNPDVMKELQSPDAGQVLHRDGHNLPSVVARLRADRPDRFERVKEFLQAIIPGITDVNRIALGPSETLEFRQDVRGSKNPWTFYAANMSDGTLRALATLVAVVQLADHRRPVSLIGIEEPESALHPFATGALVDALREAAAHTQIVVTTHSPDLLDRIDPASDALLVAISREGNSLIAPPDHASLEAIKNHLYTAGELLRMDQLEPNPADLERQQSQLRLFADDGDAQ